MDFERRLARIEGKINIIARAVSLITAVGAGFAAYFITRADGFAPYVGSHLAVYVGFGAAVLFGGLVDWDMRRLEKRLPDYPEDSN